MSTDSNFPPQSFDCDLDACRQGAKGRDTWDYTVYSDGSVGWQPKYLHLHNRDGSCDRYSFRTVSITLQIGDDKSSTKEYFYVTASLGERVWRPVPDLYQSIPECEKCYPIGILDNSGDMKLEACELDLVHVHKPHDMNRDTFNEKMESPKNTNYQNADPLSLTQLEERSKDWSTYEKPKGRDVRPPMFLVVRTHDRARRREFWASVKGQTYLRTLQISIDRCFVDDGHHITPSDNGCLVVECNCICTHNYTQHHEYIGIITGVYKHEHLVERDECDTCWCHVDESRHYAQIRSMSSVVDDLKRRIGAIFNPAEQ
ncbi:hypothetical protein GGR57DRAFT_507824 [Xylariaceae sp. FL1272]|nr:hypothetical protein GGR57DRAFT_507824 [Xylariaceae sp. FL1272]